MSKIYKHPDFIKLRKLAPNAKCSTLTCIDNRCSNNYETNTTQFVKCATNDEWLLNLSCKVCKNRWSICTTCSNFKTKLLNNRMISLHRCTYHNANSKKRKSNNIKSNDSCKTKIIKTITDKVITDDDNSPNKICSLVSSVIIDKNECQVISCDENNQSNECDDIFNMDDFNYAFEFENNNPGTYPTINSVDSWITILQNYNSSQSNNMQKIISSLRPNTWVLGDAITRLFDLWNQLPELKNNGIHLWSPELVHTMAVNGGRESFKQMVEGIRDNHKIHIFVGATQQDGQH